jgi:hypothetical protein
LAKVSILLVPYPLENYLKETKNVLDSILIVVCVSELFFHGIAAKSLLEDYLLFLKILKATLLYRLLKYNAFAQNILEIAYETLPTYANLMLLMFFLIFNYSLLGLQIFKDKFDKKMIIG